MKDRTRINTTALGRWIAIASVMAALLIGVVLAAAQTQPGSGSQVAVAAESSSGADIVQTPDESLGPLYVPVPVPLIPQTFDLIAVRGDEPCDIAISPDGSRAYVQGRNTDNLFVIDVATNQIIEVIDLYPETDHPLGPAPERVAITPDGGRLLVTTFNDNGLTVIDTASNTVVNTLPMSERPADVAISPDGSLAYVSVAPSDSIVKVVDVAAAEVLTAIAGVSDSWGPGAVAFAPDGSRAYVAMMSGSVFIIDPATHTIVGNIAVPGACWPSTLVISADSSTGYLSWPEGDMVIVLDLVGDQVADTFAVSGPMGLALNDDGSCLYVGTGGLEYDIYMSSISTS